MAVASALPLACAVGYVDAREDAAVEAEGMAADLPALKLAKQQFERLAERGGPDDGTQAVYKVYQT